MLFTPPPEAAGGDPVERHPATQYIAADTASGSHSSGRRKSSSARSGSRGPHALSGLYGAGHNDALAEEPLACTPVPAPDRALHFIRPYDLLAGGLDWGAVRLDRSAWVLGGYTDPRVMAEFRRFVYRDAMVFLILPLYTSGTHVYVPFDLLYFGPYKPLMLVWGTIVFLCALADIALHTLFKPDQSNALFRAINASIGISLTVVITAYVIVYSSANCDKSTELSQLLWDRPDLTPERIQKRCVETLSPFPLVTATIIANAYRVEPLLIAVCLVLGIACETVSRLDGEVDPANESWRFLFVKFGVLVLCSIAAGGILYIRHALVKRQFEQTVALHLATRKAEAKEAEVDALLASTLPESALERLSRNEPVLDSTGCATVLFSDMVSFTRWSSARTPLQVVTMLNDLCSRFDVAAMALGVEKIKTIGDAYWAVSGLPEPVQDHADRVVNLADKMTRIVAQRNRLNPDWGGDVRLRIGVHSGPLAGGVLGTQQLSYEVFGTTNTVAQLAEQQGVPGTVTITMATQELVGHMGIPLPGQRPLEVPAGVLGRTASTIPLFTVSRSRVTEGGDDSASMQSSLSSAQLGSNQKSNATSASDAEHQAARRKFLRDRAAKRVEATGVAVDGGDDSGDAAERLAALRAKYTTRRYGWVFMWLADDAAEAEFDAFVRAEMRVLHATARGCLAVFVAALIACVFIEGTAESVHWASWALLALSLLLATATVPLCYLALLPVNVDIGIVHVAATALIVGVGLIHEFSNGDRTTIVIANEPTYVHVLVTFSVSFAGVGSLPAAYGTALNLVLFIAPMVFFIRDVVQLSVSVMFLFLAIICIAFALIGTERLARIQFVEHVVASFYAHEAAQRRAEQEALLASVVPRHIIRPLMAWMATAFDPAEAITRHYEAATIAFVRLAGAGGGGGGGSSSPSAGATAAPEADDGFFVAHRAVDEVLAAAPLVEKVKTIGDVVMLGGPFDKPRVPAATLALAAAQLVAAVGTLRRAAGDAVCAGAHVGEVQGAVLGSSRLCFDVFGDTVNVASRVTSGVAAAGAGMGVSAAFFAVLHSDAADTAATSQGGFEPVPVPVEAKGKGTLMVHMQRAEPCGAV